MKVVQGGIFKKKPAPAPAAPVSPVKAPGLSFLSSLKKDVSLKLMIHKSLAGLELPRDPSILHASDLMRPEGEFCPREHAFLMMGVAKKKSTFVGTALRITYQHGRDLENHIRNTWLRESVVGHWKCGVCKKLSEFGKAPKVKCTGCGWGHQWNYEEVRFTSPISGISCGIDALVNVGETHFRIAEVKTLAIDGFKKLTAPLAEHKFRTSLYMKLVEESPLPYATKVNIKEANLLYAAKSFGVKDDELKEAGVKDAAFSPFKEFVLQRDDAIVAVPVRKAITLKAWRDNPNVGMPCGVCVNGLTKRAQQCSAVSACWSGNFPNTLTWTEEDGKPRHAGKKVVI
jgi:hypothetical protein